jgi:hypothetical protein
MTWAQSMKYQELVAQGMPRDQAFKIAYPNGLQSPEDIKKQEAKSAQGQGLAQVGGMVGGLVGARYGMNQFDKWMNPATEAATNTALTGAGTTAGTTAGTAAGTVPSGEILSATRVAGQAPVEGLTAANYAGGALGLGLGGYNTYKGVTTGNELQSALGGASMGLGLNALGVGLGPYGWAAMVAAPVVASLLKHESTRDVAKKHTKQLMKMGKDDAQWQNYVSGMRQQYNAPPPDKSKPFAGKYASWEAYKAGGLESNDLTGVYGNLKTFGPEWAKLNFNQQKAVTQGIIDAGLYDSKKGEVIITDPQKALEIKNQVLGQPQKQNFRQSLEQKTKG